MMAGMNVGIFAHSLASQMEVEVAAMYALAMMFLGLNDEKDGWKADAPFWITVGIAGWIKSPAHCVLMGSSAFVYWTFTGQIIRKLKNAGTYLAIFTGIIACIIGFIPVMLHDFANWREFYLMRENVTKANNNRSWDYVVAPLLHFALPWTTVLVLGLVRGFKPPKESRRLLLLGLSVALPTIIFWATFRYKGQNYNLPALSALFVAGMACFSKSIPRFAYVVMGIIGLLALILTMILIFHFMPLPGWWKLGWVLASLGSLLIFSAIFLFATDVRALGVGAMFFFIAYGSFITPLGQREMIDLKSFINEHPEIVIHYDDLDPSIWSEWGLLQLALHREIFGVHKVEHLPDALRPGHALLVSGDAGLERAIKAWEQNQSPAPNTSLKASTSSEAIAQAAGYKVTTWKRWMTKGKSPDGTPMWKVAWETHDLSKLERTFYIFWIPQN